MPGIGFMELIGSREEMAGKRAASRTDLDDARRMNAARRVGKTFQDGVANEKMLAELAWQGLV
jgi:hypothetical protein